MMVSVSNVSCSVRTVEQAIPQQVHLALALLLLSLLFFSVVVATLTNAAW